MDFSLFKVTRKMVDPALFTSPTMVLKTKHLGFPGPLGPHLSTGLGNTRKVWLVRWACLRRTPRVTCNAGEAGSPGLHHVFDVKHPWRASFHTQTGIMEEIQRVPRCLLSDSRLTETANVTVPPALQVTQHPLMTPAQSGPESWASGSHLNSNPSGEPKLHALTINFQFKPPGSFPSHCFHLLNITTQTGRNELISTQLVPW